MPVLDTAAPTVAGVKRSPPVETRCERNVRAGERGGERGGRRLRASTTLATAFGATGDDSTAASQLEARAGSPKPSTTAPSHVKRGMSHAER